MESEDEVHTRVVRAYDKAARARSDEERLNAARMVVGVDLNAAYQERERRLTDGNVRVDPLGRIEDAAGVHNDVVFQVGPEDLLMRLTVGPVTVTERVSLSNVRLAAHNPVPGAVARLKGKLAERQVVHELQAAIDALAPFLPDPKVVTRRKHADAIRDVLRLARGTPVDVTYAGG